MIYSPACESRITKRGCKRIFDQMMHYVQQAKLPRRRKRPIYPREIWRKGGKFPARKPDDHAHRICETMRL